MYTGARPYGNMKQQTLVEEVVMRCGCVFCACRHFIHCVFIRILSLALCGVQMQPTLVAPPPAPCSGLRPKFPSHTPPAYVGLAQACWSGSAQSRPTFDEVQGSR